MGSPLPRCYDTHLLLTRNRRQKLPTSTNKQINNIVLATYAATTGQRLERTTKRMTRRSTTKVTSGATLSQPTTGWDVLAGTYNPITTVAAETASGEASETESVKTKSR